MINACADHIGIVPAYLPFSWARFCCCRAVLSVQFLENNNLQGSAAAPNTQGLARMSLRLTAINTSARFTKNAVP